MHTFSFFKEDNFRIQILIVARPVIEEREKMTKRIRDREKISRSQIYSPKIMFQLNTPKTTGSFLGQRSFGITRKRSDVINGLLK